MKHILSLSPTSLNLFLECPRCFWLQVNQSVHRPFVPFPSLPGGMEEKVKGYLDVYRRQGNLPPEVAGKLEGSLFPDENLLARWRNWREGISFYDAGLNSRLMGAIDDLLVQGDRCIPLDYKSRGSAPTSDSPNHYQNQLDCYAFLLERNGYKTSGTGYLLFYYPLRIQSGGIIALAFTPIRVRTVPERAEETFHRAVSVLRGPIPQGDLNCGFCRWASRVLLQDLA